jgi:ATP-dependent DNA helicase DinG
VIQHRRTDSSASPEHAPWLAMHVERTVFCALWTSGADTTLDGIFRVQALRRGADDGRVEAFDSLCNPFAEGDDDPATQARMARELGIAREDLGRAPRAPDVWRALEEFIGDRPVIASDCDAFEAWRAHFGAAPRGALATGPAEIAALLFPGRLGHRREALGPRACDALELRAALAELVERFLDQPEDALRLCASGYVRAARALAEHEERAAGRLLYTLSLVDRPDAWKDANEPCLAPAGRLAPLLAHELPLDDLLETLRPRCAREHERWSGAENLPPDRDEPLAFDAQDRAMLDDVFAKHLPAAFAAEHGASSYRAGQHAVARAVADVLGSRQLLLVHAPTGTGKTLAYLVPAMLWARRHAVRIGVATYTRALQEQAMDREVPRALAALARAGIASGLRISVLKGRENYLCWRALKLAVPAEDDGGEAWLAWTALALFAVTDLDGDLDRLPSVAPLPLDDSAEYSRSWSALARHVRATTACCTHRDDRETCAAEIARRRAEKSHVVISNQAFVLARQEFFKHIVFDECEHLHDQAHSAWSHLVGMRSIRGALGRLHQGARTGSRGLLDRLARALVDTGPSHDALARATGACSDASVALGRLEAEAERFLAWREEKLHERSERDAHSLLREYVEGAESEGLVESRRRFAQCGYLLDSTLAELAERLDAMPMRGLARSRRSLEILRADLAEILLAIEAWIPLDEGRPVFRPRTFYDVERDARGDIVLASRVLLPNEFLGRQYHPSLSTGVFLSATTWLQESFEPARAYLGLDRAAKPDPEEDRPPCVVRTFRAPDVFDYGRVLVAVPRDVPSVVADKDAFLDHVRRFVAYLGERTRGRMLVLFTNAQDAVRVGEELTGFFRARRIPLWFQNMEGSAKEELSELFRSRIDSVLLGVDTFWYGADFPGETLEYLVIVKLPYGVPDRYHHAQCAALGAGEQRRRIYLPRALAKFRQGFGRLMRRESDRGCVFILDGRVLEPRHRFYLKELPIAHGLESAGARGPDAAACARFVRGDTDRCIREALEHMGLSDDLRRRGLEWSFASSTPPPGEHGERAPSSSEHNEPANDELDSTRTSRPRPLDKRREHPPDKGREHPPDRGREHPLDKRREHPLDIPLEDLPF